MNSALLCGADPPRKRESASGDAPYPHKLHLNSLESKPCGAFAQQMLRQIQSLRAMQAPFGFVFWFFEQRIARLADEIERLRT
jgi:hypothetical protein